MYSWISVSWRNIVSNSNFTHPYPRLAAFTPKWDDMSIFIKLLSISSIHSIQFLDVFRIAVALSHPSHDFRGAPSEEL